MTRHAALLSLLLTLAGCQQTLAPQPAFVLGLPAASTPTRAVPAPAAIAPTPSGRVTVNFSQALPRARQLLATLADVDHVTIVLHPASGPDQTVTVTKAAIANGIATATFDGVAPGTATYTVTVKDATNKTIGYLNGSVSVIAGQTATATANLELAPSFVAPTPNTGGSGGGNPPTTGSVATSITLADGVNVLPLEPVQTLHVPIHNNMTPSGTANVFWGTAFGSLVKFDRQGTVLTTNTDHVWTSLATNHLGNLVALAEDFVWHGGTAGGYLGFLGAGTSVSVSNSLGNSLGFSQQVAVTTNGVAWATIAPHLVGRTASGVELRLDNQGQTFMSVDHQGSLYGLSQQTNQATNMNAYGKLTRIDAAGTPGADAQVVWTIQPEAPQTSFMTTGVDEEGTLWVVAKTATGHQLVSYGRDGTRGNAYPLPAALDVPGFTDWNTAYVNRILNGPDGSLYVFSASSHSVGPSTGPVVLAKLNADRSPGGIYYAPGIPDNVTINDVVTDGGAQLVVLGLETGNNDRSVQYFYDLP